MEFAPGALAWWAQAARSLREGYLVAFDYGWDETDGWRLASPGGTLRGFRGHGMAASVLDCPGEQDLTAHVNWGLIRLVGEEAGLSTVGLTPQGRWLSRVAAQALSHPSSGLEWTASEIRQFQMLSHPEHLGVRFQVFVQGRGSVLDVVGAS